MKFSSFLLCAIVMSASSGYAQAAQPPLLVEYPFLCPSCSEVRSISVRYASDGTSLLETHAQAATPQIAPSNDDSKYLPGELIAGPMTEFALGRIQHWDDEVGTNFIEVQQAAALQDGVRYVDLRLNRAADQPGRASWSIDDVSVSLEDSADDREIQGLPADHLTATLAYTRTEYDADGSPTGSTRTTHTYDLWMSDALPFSPLPFQYEPFVGNHVLPYNGGPVGARLMATLVPQLQPHGGLLRAQITIDGDTAALEAQELRGTPEPPMEKFAALPVVSSEQVSQFAGPLFIASLLRADMLGDEVTARVSLDGRELEAVSAWTTNEAGDLVIVVSARDENTSLFLSRPINGVPDAGTYDTTAKISYSQLREMGTDVLAAHTARFQLNGVATDRTLPTVLMGFEEGSVIIREADGDTISGAVSGTVSALPTEEVSKPRAIPIEMSFEAPPGLEDFRFRTDESRVAR